MDINMPREFQGKTVTIVGGGASLKGFDFGLLQQPVIAVNDSVMHCAAVMLVANDVKWWRAHAAAADAFTGRKVCINETGRKDVTRLHLQPDHSSKDLDWHIARTNLSGFTALALAFVLGATRAHLLGFDGGYNGNMSHYYKDAPFRLKTDDYEQANAGYDYFKYYPVTNFSKDSKITAFKKLPLNEYYVCSTVLT